MDDLIEYVIYGVVGWIIGGWILWVVGWTLLVLMVIGFAPLWVAVLSDRWFDSDALYMPAVIFMPFWVCILYFAN